MPTVVVKNHVRDQGTFETYYRGVHKVDEETAYRLTSEHPDDVELQEVSATEGAADLAAENDVNLEDVEATGADGKVTKPDVQKFLADQEQTPEEAPTT